jgi:hypothetical protein
MVVASAPFQYDPNASGINDIPYVSGIESGMAWLDSVVLRHEITGPLIEASGFKWYKYYSEDNRERVYPKIAPPFALEGMPMNVSGFWGQFRDKIAFVGRETGINRDHTPWTNHANNAWWSGHYRDPIFSWATSGLNTKPLPEGMFEYGQIDKRDYNTYIKKSTGASANFSQRHSIRRRILGIGHAQSQVGISQTPTMDSESEFFETVNMSSGVSDELIETKERHIIRAWSVAEDCNATYTHVKNMAALDAVGSGVPYLRVEYYVNEGYDNDPYVYGTWFWQLGLGSGWDIGGIKPYRVLGDINEDYYARSFTVINDNASTYQLGKTVEFTDAPTSVTYSLAKRLALVGSGYGIYSNFVPNASSVSPCSPPSAVGNYNWGYKMGDYSLSSAASKQLLYGTSGYDVFHTEGPITNGTPPFVTNGTMDPVFLDGDDTSNYVWLTRSIDDIEPVTVHPQKTASWPSYFVERFTEISGVEQAGRTLVCIAPMVHGGGYHPRTPTNTQTFDSDRCTTTVATDVWVPTSLGFGGGNTGYWMSGLLVSKRDYTGSSYRQSAYRTQKTPPSGVFSIAGPDAFLGVDPPLNIFGTLDTVGSYFGL